MPEPRHADAVAEAKSVTPGPSAATLADDLMTENERQLGMRQLAVEDVQVGAADAAGRDLDEDLLGSGSGTGSSAV